MSEIEIKFDSGVRADLVCCSGINLSGKRTLVRVFPTGSKKGKVKISELRSMIIGAPFGTRITLITEPGPDWEKSPWRAMEMIKGNTLTSGARGGLPGIRVPDLDRLDGATAKMALHDREVSYFMAESLDNPPDDAWSYGRVGPMKGRVREIRIERPSSVQEHIGLITIFLVDPDKIDEARPLLRDLAEMASHFRRCERADVFMTRDRPGQFTFFAEFLSSDAAEELPLSTRYIELVDRVRPYLVREPSTLLTDRVD